MEVIQTAHAVQARADALRLAGHRLALVPTMGALHEGHLELVRTAHRHADVVMASIFVNPTQFGPGEDFERYPRPLEADLDRLRAEGVEVAFTPATSEMYPRDGAAATWVEVEGLDARLCGAHRPGHFRGVTTIVAKLFHLCRPHAAVFGLKDAQQFVILRRMVDDLDFGIEMVGVPTVRESDGLAMSSRNAYLTPEHRAQAVVLSQAVEEARRRVQAGEQRPERLVEAMRSTLGAAPDGRIQYAEVVDAGTLQPVGRIEPGQQVLAAVAVHFGRTRLIDNAFIEAPRA